MKNFIKNIFSNKYLRLFIAWIFHLYMFLVYKTSKIIIKGNYEEILRYVKIGKGIVLFTWHGRSFISPIELSRLFKNEKKNGRKIVVLSSIHRDGKIASSIMSTFGIGVIEGSTIDPKKGSSKNKKSMSSLRNTMKALSDGTICVLAPDGPRGPAFRMNTKITNIVEKTKTAITCVSISYKNKKTFNTWDYFQLPYPFGTILIEYGEIFKVDIKNSPDNINCILEKKLNEMIYKNDKQIYNRPPA